MPDPGAPKCYCGAGMILRETQKFRYKKSQKLRKFWGCSRWPECDGTVGAHPNGDPVGHCADAETKLARIRAHAAFDRLWKKGGKMTRASAYKRLAAIMQMDPKDAHIGNFTKDQCERLLEALNATP